jgi:uncharacterized membrane protein YjgN (DUF898 family)
MASRLEDETAFSFEGKFSEYLPIALSNLFLSIITLGIYRFWAKTRTRKFYWSNTRFIDDHLEWTGTGKELFLGFLIALVIILVPFFGVQFVVQALLLRGQAMLAGILGGVAYIGLLYLTGVATFRALRYRLSRTFWHGIHGGSDDNGLRYGFSWLWRNFAAYIAVALLFPWAMTKLWQERWTAMSFGPHRFTSTPTWTKLMPRYLAPFGFAIVMAMIVYAKMPSPAGMVGGTPSLPSGAIGALMLAFVGFYIVLPLLALAYYAAYLREMVGTLKLSTLEFQFTARTTEWLMLVLGNFGIMILAYVVGIILLLVIGGFTGLGAESLSTAFLGGASVIALLAAAIALIVPLGIAAAYVSFRNWAFFVEHLEATGIVDITNLTQSTTPALRQGEGLLDAFDMGAI